MGTRGQPEESRAAILDAAAREFAQYGIAGARTDAIAREAHVNKALLYYYFNDGDLPPKDKMLAYVGAYFDFIASNQLYPRLMQREMMRAREGETQQFEKLVKAYIQPIFMRVSQVLQEGIGRGEFRPVKPEHFVPSIVAMIVFYFSSAPMMQKIVGFNPLAPQRVAERRAAVLDFVSAALFQQQPPGKQGARS